jgi:hypothetical protein
MAGGDMTQAIAAAEVTAHDRLIAQWARAGAMFGLEPADTCPDLERLLLSTAAPARRDSRLFIMAFTWLCRFGDLVAKHRLRRMIIDQLPREHWPVLGLLFDLVRHQTKSPRFNAVVKTCAQAALPEPQPLFEIESRLAVTREIAQRDAQDASRTWHLWVRPMELKFDALRAPDWIIARNPSWRIRAELKGDLRASMVVELELDPSAGESELELARRTGATRAAVRSALVGLELAGRIERVAIGLRRATRLRQPNAA